MIDKKDIYVIRHAKSLFEGATNLGVKNVEIESESGVQGATLYDENFILSITQKYKPDLLVAFANG